MSNDNQSIVLPIAAILANTIIAPVSGYYCYNAYNEYHEEGNSFIDVVPDISFCWGLMSIQTLAICYSFGI